MTSWRASKSCATTAKPCFGEGSRRALGFVPAGRQLDDGHHPDADVAAAGIAAAGIAPAKTVNDSSGAAIEQDRSTSVYVHFPYCARKCPYCDFASIGIDRSHIPHEAYADAVLRELDWRRKALEGRSLVSIFVGGGTPSLWQPEALGRVLAGVRARFASEVADLEITVECNPSSLDAGRAQALTAAGVTRLSIGVQSLRDRHLAFLGRLHDGAEATASLAAARAAVPRVSADLMFGMKGQTFEELRGDAEAILATGVDHISAYALTVEPNTPFHVLAKQGRLGLAGEGLYADMFRDLATYLADRGLGHYEVSNYARPGGESRHNLHYWRGLAYLGLGAGAVGCLMVAVGRAARWRNQANAARYIAQTEPTTDFEETLDAQTLVREALMLGLRTKAGVDLARVQRRAGIAPLDGRERAVERRIRQGDLVCDGQILRVPEDRWLHLDSVVTDLF